jgi:hypothetical protein
LFVILVLGFELFNDSVLLRQLSYRFLKILQEIRIGKGQVLNLTLKVLLHPLILLLMPHQEKVILLLIAHIDHNLFQIFLSQLVSVVLELVIIFLCLPSVVYFVQLLNVVELPLQLRLNCLLAINLFAENAFDEALYFLTWWQVKISHSEDRLSYCAIQVTNFLKLLRFQKLVHSFSLVRVELGLIIFILLVVIVS